MKTFAPLDDEQLAKIEEQCSPENYHELGVLVPMLLDTIRLYKRINELRTTDACPENVSGTECSSYETCSPCYENAARRQLEAERGQEGTDES
jgi:hypothetical protein